MDSGMEWDATARLPEEPPSTVIRMARYTHGAAAFAAGGEDDFEAIALIDRVRELIPDAAESEACAIAHASLNRLECLVRGKRARLTASEPAERIKRTGRAADFFALSLQASVSPPAPAPTPAPAKTPPAAPRGDTARHLRTIMASSPEPARPTWKHLLGDRTIVAAIAFAAIVSVTTVSILRRPGLAHDAQGPVSRQR